MTDAELDRLEGLFRHPPSAAALTEEGLALVRELRALRPAPEPVVVIDDRGSKPSPLQDELDTPPFTPDPEPVLEGHRPTPPASVARSHHKKGK